MGKINRRKTKKKDFCSSCPNLLDDCNQDLIDDCEEKIFDNQNQDFSLDYEQYSDADSGL